MFKHFHSVSFLQFSGLLPDIFKQMFEPFHYINICLKKRYFSVQQSKKALSYQNNSIRKIKNAKQ